LRPEISQLWVHLSITVFVVAASPLRVKSELEAIHKVRVLCARDTRVDTIDTAIKTNERNEKYGTKK
jgi:hypothetical protein